MKKIYSFLILLMFACSVNAQTDYTIGSASGSNTNTAYPCPIQDFYEGGRSQYLYLASELQAAGMAAGLINSIKFDVSNLNSFTGTVEQYSIAIGTTATASLTATDWEPGATAVYGPVDYVPTVGTNEFIFSAPFFWNGTDNIIVEICNGDPGNAASGVTTWTGNVSSPWTTALAFNGSHNYRADNLGNLCGSTTTSNTGTQTTRPDITFAWITATACSGTPAAGTAVSSLASVCLNQAFTVSITNGFLGTGLTYQWQKSIDNGTNWTDVTGATNYSLLVSTGISVNTCYRRKTKCTASNVEVQSVRTCLTVKPFYECYCSPLTNNILYTASAIATIESVAIVGTAVNYNNANPGSAAAPSLGYTAFTDTTVSVMPVLKQAVSYTLTTTTSTTPVGAGIWIDWNHNNLFDSSEYQQIPFADGTTTTDITVDIPATAPLGLTMMRIRTRNAAFNYSTACASFGNGETEDYIFRVTAGTPCSGTPIGGAAASSVDSTCPNNPFTLSVNGATDGVTNLTYQWESSPNCGAVFTPISGATAKTYTVPSISAEMSFRRKITCGGSSVYSTPICLHLKPISSCYCGPNTGIVLQGGSSPWVNNVTITDAGTYNWDFVGAGGVNENNAPPIVPLAYSMYSDTMIMAHIAQAVPYTMTLTTSAQPGKAICWIDYDHSGTFDVSEGQVLTVSGTSSTVTITPPATAQLGVTLMRIRIRAANFTDPCEQIFSGETEDYVISIIPGTTCSGTPLAGDAVSSNDSVCKNTAFNLSVTNSTAGVIGLTYEWYSSATAGGTYTAIAGATSQTYTVPKIISDSCYKRGVKCSGGTEVFSTAICVVLKSQFECYCSPLNGTTLHSPAAAPSIDTVMLVGNGVNYFSEDIGFNPPTGYIAFTDTSLAPHLTQGETYTLTTNLSANPGQESVFIDWDQSGTFEATEAQKINFATGTKNASLDIVIPATATPGFTMMRIRARAATFTTACEQFGSGETEDHLIKITPGTFCSGTPIGGTTNSTTTTACKGVNFTLTVAGSSTAVGILGLTYQWEDSIVGGNWSSIATATKLNYSTSLTTANRYFRRKIICSNGNGIAYSSVILITLNTPTYTTLPFAESFENPWIDGCGATGARSIPTNNWRNTPFTGDTSWRRNDDGISANWTNEASGAYSPTAAAGTKSARFHTASILSNASSNLDLYLNCTGGSTYKKLTFNYINTDGNDSLSILVSTDGGVTFNRVDSVGNRTTWGSKRIDFASTSATTIIRFKAYSEVAGTSDIGLDNINIVSLLPIDITATVIVSPTGTIGATSTGSVTFTVKNIGGSDLNFASTPLIFGALVSNSSTPNPLGTTINTGTLAINATQNITVNNVDLTNLGLHTLRGYTAIVGDGNIANDTTIQSSVTVNGAAKIAVTSGFWGDGATWNGGVIPVATDTVNITGFTVTLNGGATPGPYSCNSIGLGASGTLIGNAATLNVGPAGGGNKAFSIASGATLNLSGATINHNGYMIFNSGANFTMSAGDLNIDGNDGTNIGSVANNIDIFGIGTTSGSYTSGTLNLTGGTITITDPHRTGGTAFGYRSILSTNIGAGNTLVMGNPASNHTASSGVVGFLVALSPGGAKMSVGNLIINGGNAVGNRYTTTVGNAGINGNLTINANSEFRMSVQPYITGNITNNGVFASPSTINLQTYLSGIVGAVTSTQTISGNGVYRNTIPAATIVAAGTGYSVGDVVTVTGGTATTPLAIYVTSVGGTGNITSAAVLNLGNYTVAPIGAVTVTGGSGTGATFTTANTVSSANFNSLVVNNTSAGGINISSFGTMLPSQTGTLGGAGATFRLTDGIINNAVTITLGNSIAQRGNLIYANGVITGKFARWFAAATNTTTTGDFPVGKGNYARSARIEYTTAPTKGGILTAEYIATAPGLGGFPINDGITLNNIANDGFWRIDNDTITGGNYTVSITDSGIVNAQTVSTLRIVKRPSNTTNWTIDGLAGTNSGSLSKPTVVRTALSGFSEFAIAGANDNLLPSTSITFKGEKAGSINKFSWVVVNEINVKGYELQKGSDNKNFETITFINSKSQGSSNVNLTYSYNDNSSIYSDGYYRLKQISRDGTIAYSNIVLVKGLKVNNITVGNIYPNPAKDVVNIVVAAPKNNNIIVIISDMNGKQVATHNKTVNIGDNVLNINVNTLAAGNYLLNIIDLNGTKSNTIGFVKQ